MLMLSAWPLQKIPTVASAPSVHPSVQEVIRLAPNVPDSYQTLALIHEALDQPQKALDFMLIAAHMGKREAEPWRRLAAQSVELKNLRQAIYCLSRVCKFDLGDVDARWDRAVLLSEIGDVKKAAQAFEGLRKMRPHVRVSPSHRGEARLQ